MFAQLAKKFGMSRDSVERLRLGMAPVLGRLTLAAVFARAALLIFFKIAHEVAESDTQQFDAAVVGFFRAHQPPPLHALMTAISWLAAIPFQVALIAVCVFVCAGKQRFWTDGVALLIAGAGGAALISSLKWLFHRPRPDEIFAHLGYSFPSGHSFFAVVVYGMLAYWLARGMSPPRRRTIWAVAIIAILLVGFSRVFLGEHYPSDVAAGFATGIPWLWGCLMLPALLKKKPPSVQQSKKRNPRSKELL